MKIPAIDETSRASTRLGGMLHYWLDEAALKTASQPKFRTMEFTPNKVIVLCYATDELLQDVAMLEAIIKQGFAEEIAFALDDAIVRGTGAGRPLGLLASGAKVAVAKEAGQAADTIVYSNIRKMWARLHPACRKDAVWLINVDAEPELWQMSLAIGTGGSAVFMPGAGASAAPYSTLMGRPIVPTEAAATLGDEGDIILFSPSQYCIVDKGSTDVQMSIHIRFQYDESVKFAPRNGDVAVNSSLKRGNLSLVEIGQSRASKDSDNAEQGQESWASVETLHELPLAA